MSHKKKGDPIPLVISPTGNSAGRINILDKTSAAIIIEAPINAELKRT